MEKSFYIDLSGIAHPAPADMPSPSLTTVHTIPGAERTAHAGTGGEAMLQEFDGLFGYINQLDSTTSTSRMLPVHVVRADLHAFYLTQAHAQAELMDASARVIYTLHPERACYCYLPRDSTGCRSQRGTCSCSAFTSVSVSSVRATSAAFGFCIR